MQEIMHTHTHIHTYAIRTDMRSRQFPLHCTVVESAAGSLSINRRPVGSLYDDCMVFSLHCQDTSQSGHLAVRVLPGKVPVIVRLLQAVAI